MGKIFVELTMNEAIKLLFRDANAYIHSTASGDLLISSSNQLTLGVPGDITLGDGVVRLMSPVVDGNINMGSPGLRFGDGNFKGAVRVGGLLEGARLLLCFGEPATTASGDGDYFLKQAGGSIGNSFPSIGYVMPRAGSIVSLAVNFEVSIHTTTGNLTMVGMLGGANTFLITEVISATGVKNFRATQARGVDTFAAGDTFKIKVDFTTWVGSIKNVTGIIEIVFDT